jgi:hypothetical protein
MTNNGGLHVLNGKYARRENSRDRLAEAFSGIPESNLSK